MTRFQIKGGYKFDKYLFRGLIGVVILLSLIGVFIEGFGNFERQVYVYCPEDTPGGVCYIQEEGTVCNDVFCYQEGTPLFAGESIGTPPGWYYKHFGLIMLGVIVLTLGINHFLHNKGFGLWGQLWK